MLEVAEALTPVHWRLLSRLRLRSLVLLSRVLEVSKCLLQLLGELSVLAILVNDFEIQDVFQSEKHVRLVGVEAVFVHELTELLPQLALDATELPFDGFLLLLHFFKDAVVDGGRAELFAKLDVLRVDA